MDPTFQRIQRDTAMSFFGLALIVLSILVGAGFGSWFGWPLFVIGVVMFGYHLILPADEGGRSGLR